MLMHLLLINKQLDLSKKSDSVLSNEFYVGRENGLQLMPAPSIANWRKRSEQRYINTRTVSTNLSTSSWSSTSPTEPNTTSDSTSGSSDNRKRTISNPRYVSLSERESVSDESPNLIVNNTNTV